MSRRDRELDAKPPKAPKPIGWATTVVSMLGASVITYGLVFLWYLSKR